MKVRRIIIYLIAPQRYFSPWKLFAQCHAGNETRGLRAYSQAKKGYKDISRVSPDWSDERVADGKSFRSRKPRQLGIELKFYPRQQNKTTNQSVRCS